MDYRFIGLPSYYVLVLMLLKVQWRPVFAAPTNQPSCAKDLEQTGNLSKLLKHEAHELLDKYTEFHQCCASASVPGDVPASTISGDNVSAKLQDIYSKSVIFHLHISKVEEYQKQWENTQLVTVPLQAVKGRLTHLSASVKSILTKVQPEIPLPSTPAPPELSHDHDYKKKVYGWAVISRLEEWLKQVLNMIQTEEVCDM